MPFLYIFFIAVREKALVHDYSIHLHIHVYITHLMQKHKTKIDKGLGL